MQTGWTFVWQDSGWQMNLIEPDTMEWTYLAMPNELPAQLMPGPARA